MLIGINHSPFGAYAQEVGVDDDDDEGYERGKKEACLGNYDAKKLIAYSLALFSGGSQECPCSTDPSSDRG